MRLHPQRLALTISALVSLVVELVPSATGIGFHETFCMAATLIMLAHCLLSARSNISQLDRTIDVLLLVDLAAIFVSGLLISGGVLPFFGVYVQTGYFLWAPIHALSAKLLLGLVLIHAASHLPHIKSLLSKSLSKER